MPSNQIQLRQQQNSVRNRSNFELVRNFQKSSSIVQFKTQRIFTLFSVAQVARELRMDSSLFGQGGGDASTSRHPYHHHHHHHHHEQPDDHRSRSRDVTPARARDSEQKVVLHDDDRFAIANPNSREHASKHVAKKAKRADLLKSLRPKAHRKNNKLMPKAKNQRAKPAAAGKAEAASKKKKPNKFDPKKRVYEVKTIHGCYYDGVRGTKTLYLVEWVGYPLDQGSWEREGNLHDAEWSIQEFEKNHGKASPSNKLVLDDVGMRYEQNRTTGNTKEGRDALNSGKEIVVKSLAKKDDKPGNKSNRPTEKPRA